MFKVGGITFSVLKILFVLVISITIFSNNTIAEVSNKDNETETGIEFKGTTGTSTITSSDSIPDKPIPNTKKGGVLPKTGELMQPIIFFMIGCLLFLILLMLYLSSNYLREDLNK